MIRSDAAIREVQRDYLEKTKGLEAHRMGNRIIEGLLDERETLLKFVTWCRNTGPKANELESGVIYQQACEILRLAGR